MAYAEIIDFKGGLDRRRPAVVGEPGKLHVGTNIHLTRGGDIEGRKKFVEVHTLPAGVYGFHSLRNKFYVFGTVSTPALPADYIYQQLQHPTDSELEIINIISARSYGGKVYVVAEYADGSIYHFYDGEHVTEWDTLAEQIADIEGVALYLAEYIDASDDFYAAAVGDTIVITAANAGTAFTIDTTLAGGASATVTQLQGNVAGVTETRATGSFTVTGGAAAASNYIDSITVDGVELLSSQVDWLLSHTATAAALADAINDGPSTFTATSAGAVVTITAAAGTGATPNGDVVAVDVHGILTVGSVTNMAGGVTMVAAVAQSEEVELGGFDPDASWMIELDGVNYKLVGRAAGMGRQILTYKSKIYATVRSLLEFCAVNTPMSWVTAADGGTVTPDTGLGDINVANQDEGSEVLTALGPYQNYMALFSRATVQIWSLDVDPANNTIVQTLQNTGTKAPGSVVAYGSADLFYLDLTGVRSLRARDSSNTASVNDVGTAIDDIIQEYIETLTEEEVAAAQAVIEPLSGRYWLAIGDRIYVFSYFPGSRISAWTEYHPTEIDGPIERFAVARSIVFARSGNKVYAYGGLDGSTYPSDGEVEAAVRLPYLDFNKPANEKNITGVDLACSGTWDIRLLTDPNDESKATAFLRLDSNTFAQGRHALEAHCTHVAPDLTSSSGGRKTLSSIVIHFNGQRDAT